MTAHDIQPILDVLRMGRQELVEDFRSERPELYEPMFAYRADSAGMALAISRYIFQWIDSHTAIFASLANDLADEEAKANRDLELFIAAYRRLCEAHLIEPQDPSHPKSPALEAVLAYAIEHLDKLTAMDMRAEQRIARLRYQGVKAKNLFERQFNALESQSS